MATYELIALDEVTPQLLAPTSGDTGLIVGNLTVNGSVNAADIAISTGSITCTGGTIDFGDENLTTTGLISGTYSGVVIGTDVQAWDAQLDDIAAAAIVDGNFLVANGTNWVVESLGTARASLGSSTVGDALFIAASATAAQQAMDTEVGVDIQAYDASLADIAGLTLAQGDVIYHNGTNLVNLGAGTSGYVLQTNGAAANPSWAAPSAGSGEANTASNVGTKGSGVFKQKSTLDLEFKNVYDLSLGKDTTDANDNIVIVTIEDVLHNIGEFREAAYPSLLPPDLNFNFKVWRGDVADGDILADGDVLYDNFFYNETAFGLGTYKPVRLSTDTPTLAQSGYLSDYSLDLNCTTADTSIGSTQECSINTNIEGYFYSQLDQAQFTLNFWHKHTLAGTYCVWFHNPNQNETYVAEYTQSVTDTWEEATITVSAAGAAQLSTTIGMTIGFTFVAGTTSHTTAGTWNADASNIYRATSNQVNAAGTVNNRFRLAQLSIAAGATKGAPPLRSVFAEARWLNRYYQNTFEYGTQATQNAGLTSNPVYWDGTSTGTTFAYRFPVPMRAAPTITTYNPAAAAATPRNVSDSTNANPVSSSQISKQGVALVTSSATTTDNHDTLCIHMAMDAYL